MKKWLALLLTAVMMLSGCQIVIVNPFVTAPSTEPSFDASIHTEPSTEPTEAAAGAETESTAKETEAASLPSEPAENGYFGICDMCGMPYAEGDGFESLCFDCQETYGPKCSVCGTDCTYRGTIDGMCDDCWEKNQTDVCAQCGKECLGTWVGKYYVCDTCAQKQACALCGTHYYIWDMFEGVCFDCDDPSGGAAGDLCVKCGSASGDYDGYCYYCHPNFGFTCGKCGILYPAHKTESGLCPYCEAGEVSCAACGSTVSALDATDGLCWDCYCIRTYGTCVSCGAVRNYDYSGGLCWDCYVNQSE